MFHMKIKQFCQADHLYVIVSPGFVAASYPTSYTLHGMWKEAWYVEGRSDRPAYPLAGRLSRTVSLLLSQPININQSTNHSSIHPSIHRSISQAANPSINESFDQLTNN